MFDRVILHPDNLSGVNRLLLDLASLVYTFDHEMLEYILGETIPTAEFQLLCQSSFVRVNPEGGWTVSNGIRRWAKEGLNRRSPEAYAQYKLRAEQILERRTAAAASSANEVQQEMRSGKMFLHDNDIIHGYIYYDDGLHLAGRLAGFYAALPLDDPRFRELLDRNPATRAFSACTPREPCDWLYWLIASDPPLDQGFAGQVLRDML